MTELFYMPFLKLKENEIMALKELKPPIKELMIPFFDFPTEQNQKAPKEFDEKADKAAKKIERHFGEGRTIYIDTYDIDDQIVKGIHSYLYLLQAFERMDVIPVTGIDRTPEHQQAIIDHLATKKEPEATIAYRITFEDFASYGAIQYEIEDSLDGLLHDLFTQIDLVMDCRLVHHMKQADIDATIIKITHFIESFTKNYPVRKVIITGSSIPLMLGDICKPRTYEIIERNEVRIHSEVTKSFNSDKGRIVFGDYTGISPEFAQPNQQAALNAVSKLIYSNASQQHIWRGSKVIVKGMPFQGHYYNEHVHEMIHLTPPIFRGPAYSWADAKFDDKQHDTNGFTASHIIKPIINAHISYMSQIYSR